MKPLRIGFIGSGFIARFHLKASVGVRNVEVCGVFSLTETRRGVSSIVKRNTEGG